MAIQLKHTFTIPATVERVGQALCSEAYSIEGANLREDVQSATHAVISDGAGRLDAGPAPSAGDAAHQQRG